MADAKTEHIDLHVTMDEGAGPGDNGNGVPWWALFVLTIAILGTLGLFIMWLLTGGRDGVKEAIWLRRMYLYGTVEAIAFTAVGWVFGREVHRAEAKTAQDSAKAAQTQVAQTNAVATAQAVDAADQRSKGQTFATAVIHSAESVPPTSLVEASQTYALSSMGAHASQLESLANMARALYPDA